MKENLFITLMLVLLALPLASCGDDEPLASDDVFSDLTTFTDAIDDCVFTASVSPQGAGKKYVIARVSNVEFSPSSPFYTDRSDYRGPGLRSHVQFRSSDLPGQTYSNDESTEIRFRVKAWKIDGSFITGFDTCDHVDYSIIVEPV